MISEEVNTLINTYEKMCEKYTFDSLFGIRQDEMKLILGLIANLQQENQSLKEQLKYEEDWRIKCAKERDEAIKDGLKIVQENQSLKDSRENAIEYINNHTIEWVDEKFKENNIMVKFDEYSNPQALLEILKGDK